MTQSIEDLRESILPCPFCGSRAISHHSSGPLIKWAVSCTQCDCRPVLFCPQTEADAIAAWNRRTPDPASTRALEEARFLCDRLGELEWMDDGYADVQREFFGHVEPSLARLKALLDDRSILSGGV